MHHFESGNEDTLGRHEKAVRCLEHCADLNVTVSGSWDGTVKLWDIREKTPLVGDFQQKGKVFTMSLAGTKLVVGTSGSHIDVWDLRDTKEPLQERKSPLKHMTRVIRCSPNHEGFALGSVEGRVAIEHFASEKKKSNYAFKCHRKKDADGNTIVYPVNALSFHPTYVVLLLSFKDLIKSKKYQTNHRYGTFASGGCDGTVAIWDGANKKRLCQLPQHPMGISSMDFNVDGTLLAVASSYTFEEGEKDGTSENVFVHTIKDGQVRPKKKKKKKAT